MDIYETMDNYLTKNLSEEETATFEQKLKSDPAFQEEFTLHKNIYALRYQQSEKAKAALAMVQKISRESQEKDQTNIGTANQHEARRTLLQRRWRTWAAAAAIALLVVAAYLIMPKSSSLYDQYASHDRLELTTMGQQDELKAQLEEEFNVGDYSEALQLSSELLSRFPADYDVQFAQGICYLELRKYQQALSIFEKYATGNAIDKIKGEWYMAMCYLKMEDFVNGKKTLKQLQGKGYKEVEIVAILSQI